MLSYAITPGKGSIDDILHRCAALLQAGVSMIQVREKDRRDRDIYDITDELMIMAEDTQTKILVNDRLDIAEVCGADGVHIGAHSLPTMEMDRYLPSSMLLGVSVHNAAEASAAEEAGADLITVSPVYETISKPMTGEPLGVETLEEICDSIDIQVFALGGVKEEYLEPLWRTGCDGVAGISLFFEECDCKKLMETISRY